MLIRNKQSALPNCVSDSDCPWVLNCVGCVRNSVTFISCWYRNEITDQLFFFLGGGGRLKFYLLKVGVESFWADNIQLDWHSVGPFWTSNQARRRGLYLTPRSIHKRKISMLPAGFEPAIPASERPQPQAFKISIVLVIECWFWRQRFCVVL